jgi:hypothetical protein
LLLDAPSRALRQTLAHHPEMADYVGFTRWNAGHLKARQSDYARAFKAYLRRET